MEGTPICQIAEAAGCCDSTIRRFATRFGFPAQPRTTRGETGWEAVLTEAFLLAAYVEGRMSTSAIGAEVGCSRGTVEKYLAACGIKARGHQAGVDNLLYEDLLTADRLTQRLAQRASHADIARECGCSLGTVRAAVRRLHLENLAPHVRPPAPPCASADELRTLYVDQGMSLESMAEVLGTSRTKVRADLSRFGIRPYRRPGFKETDGAWAD